MAGVLLSPHDDRDYPICMAMDISGDELPDSFTTSFQPPYANQVSGNCVAQTIANILEVMYHKFTGRHLDFSVGFIYGNRKSGDYKGEGMYCRTALMRLLEDGDVKSELFDNPGEVPGIIRAVDNFKKAHPGWYEFAYHPGMFVKASSADEVKRFILKHDIPILAVADTKDFYFSGGLHAMALYGWEGDMAILQNSWGERDKPIVKIPFGKLKEMWLISPFELSFPDDAIGHWAEKHITQLFDLDLIKGYEDNTFRPDKAMTRAELCALVYRYLRRIFE